MFAVIDASGTYSKMAEEITLARVVQAGVVPMDTARARMLYVSNRPEDHPVADYARHIAGKAVTDTEECLVVNRGQGKRSFVDWNKIEAICTAEV